MKMLTINNLSGRLGRLSMGGFEILMVLVGAAIGSGVVYWWQENRINRLEKDHKRALRKMVDSAERNYAERSYTPPQVNTRATSPSASGLLPTIMQTASDPISLLPEIAVPIEQRSSAASLPTEPLVDLSDLSDKIAAETQESQFLSPEQTSDPDIPGLSDEIAAEVEDLPSSPPDPLVDLPELSDAFPEVPSEDLTLPLLEDQTVELPELSDAMLEIPEEPSQQMMEEELLITQIFDEPPFEIEDSAVMMPRSETVTLAPLPVTLDLSNKIATKIGTWRQLANPRYIPQIVEYASHPDANVREQVAIGLGQIAAANTMHAYIPQVIPVLERLSRDRHLETRYQAIVALGQLKSERVIPILTSALHSTSSRLVKAASSALGKLNYSAPEPKPLEFPKKVAYRKPLI
jgi:HEAT repeats